MRTKRSEAGAQAEADLKYWGYHVGRQYAADGYPSDNPLLELLCGHSDLNPLAPMFGINVADIPAEAWRINALVMQLRGEHRGVLVARFALPMDFSTGQPIPADVIAPALGLSVRSYFRRLRDARERFARMKLAQLNGVDGIPTLTHFAVSA